MNHSMKHLITGIAQTGKKINKKCKLSAENDGAVADGSEVSVSVSAKHDDLIGIEDTQ